MLLWSGACRHGPLASDSHRFLRESFDVALAHPLAYGHGDGSHLLPQGTSLVLLPLGHRMAVQALCGDFEMVLYNVSL